MLAAILSAFSGLCGVVKALLGLEGAAKAKQAGVDAQQLADAQHAARVAEAEGLVEAQPSDPVKALRNGTF